jgi:hypothetical protein
MRITDRLPWRDRVRALIILAIVGGAVLLWTM